MRDVTVHWQLLTRSIYSQQKDAPGHHSLQSPLDLVSKSDFTECRFNSDHGITPELIAPPLGSLTDRLSLQSSVPNGRESSAKQSRESNGDRSFPEKFGTCSRPASRFMDAMAPDYQTLFPSAG